MTTAYRTISVKDLVAKEDKAIGKELEYYILSMLYDSVNFDNNDFVEMILCSQIFGKAMRCFVFVHTDTRHEYAILTNKGIMYHVLIIYTHHDNEAKSEFTYESGVVEICDHYGRVSYVISNQEPPEDYNFLLEQYELFVRDIRHLMSLI
jgi:hypothetical protein